VSEIDQVRPTTLLKATVIVSLKTLCFYKQFTWQNIKCSVKRSSLFDLRKSYKGKNVSTTPGACTINLFTAVIVAVLQ